MITTDTILAAAIAAFNTRYKGRPVRWDAQDPGIQQRWIQITAYALNGSVTNGQEFRYRYIRDHYPHDDAVKDWSQIGRKERDSWNAVYGSVRATGEQATTLPYPRKAEAETPHVVPTVIYGTSAPEPPAKPTPVKAKAPRKPTTRTTPKARPKPPAPRPQITPADEPILTPLPPMRDRLAERRKQERKTA